MNFARKNTALDPASMRLPLIALIDVVLFLLFYFMVAGTLAAEEASLGAAITTETAPGGRSGARLSTFEIRVEDGPTGPMFAIGSRRVRDREGLLEVLRKLDPNGSMLIKSSPEVPVSAIATAIQASKDAGFVKVSYVPGPVPGR